MINDGLLRDQRGTLSCVENKEHLVAEVVGDGTEDRLRPGGEMPEVVLGRVVGIELWGDPFNLVKTA